MDLGPLLHEKQLSPHYKALTMYDFNVLAEKMVFIKKATHVLSPDWR